MVKLSAVDVNEPRRYRLIETSVEAFRVTEGNLAAVASWCRGSARDFNTPAVWVPGSSSPIRYAYPGDFVVKHSDGRYSIVSEEKFNSLYEEA